RRSVRRRPTEKARVSSRRASARASHHTRLRSMAAPKTLTLIDASNYLYRAFHAIRGLSGPGGRPTNAVYGVATMLNTERTDRKPDAIAVAFERKERVFRQDMDAEYKAQRQPMPDALVPQIEDAKRLCGVLGYAVLEEPGYEADDLIAAIA